MLLFLGKQSRPDVANATRELSKANDDANPSTFEELLHLLKYVLDIENLGLKLKPTGNADEP